MLSDSNSTSSVLSQDTPDIRKDLYEARQTPGAGIGAFATKFIPSGTRIFCEKSFVALPDEARQIELFSAVTAFSKEGQAEYWDLADGSKPIKDIGWITELRASSEGHSESFDALVEAHEKAWSIYETNRFSMNYPSGDFKLGIFPSSSRLNHSCAPNVFHRYNPRIDRLTVYALRDIQAGEELNTSYIDICHPTDRRQQLLRNWGFSCQCSACDSPNDVADHRRRELESLIETLKKHEKQSEAGPWTEHSNERSLEKIQMGIHFMEEEGMEETDTLGFLLPLAVKYGLKTGREESALEWARRAVEIERKCLGEDSNEYHAAVKLQEAAKEAWVRSTIELRH